jgi:hypothetical protein
VAEAEKGLGTAQLARVPSRVRPTFAAARRTVRTVAPKATEIAYRSSPPRSPSAMWKIVRYAVAGAPVVGIGVYATYVALYCEHDCA